MKGKEVVILDSDDDDSDIEVIDIHSGGNRPWIAQPSTLSTTTSTSTITSSTSSASATSSTSSSTSSSAAANVTLAATPALTDGITEKSIMQLDLSRDDFVDIVMILFENAGKREAKKYLERCPKPLTVSSLNLFSKPLKLKNNVLSSTLTPPLTKGIVAYLHNRVDLYLKSKTYDPNPSPTPDDCNLPSLPCSLCASSSSLRSLVFCTNEHPFCMDCVQSYLTLTPSAMNANLSTVACVTPKCVGVFERNDVIKILGSYEALVRQERDEEVSNDEGEMEGTKKCPNCGLKISKAEGCNHVKCDVSFGGCGWEFCWLCLGKYPNCGCGGFDRESERVARELAREEESRATYRRPMAGISMAEIFGGGAWGPGNVLGGFGSGFGSPLGGGLMAYDFPDGGFFHSFRRPATRSRQQSSPPKRRPTRRVKRAPPGGSGSKKKNNNSPLEVLDMITPPKKKSRTKKRRSGGSGGGGRMVRYWLDGESEENGDEPHYYWSDGDEAGDADAEWKPDSKPKKRKSRRKDDEK
ncbi:hypothetical protein TrRE_jg5878 [Triparma retinervis]|uniref:RING-type domain-containing protein n=1 Tax=Triparma retinervis TaxID=2557542 RepID=A0A9W7AFP4_9STRA|nr:hypothetical protein TrRE_jg5878 [Triparma retinervis]